LSLLRASRSWRLRATMSRPEQNAASSPTARSGLRLFTEGFDTRGLKEAKAPAGGVSLVRARALGDVHQSFKIGRTSTDPPSLKIGQPFESSTALSIVAASIST